MSKFIGRIRWTAWLVAMAATAVPLAVSAQDAAKRGDAQDGGSSLTQSDGAPIAGAMATMFKLKRLHEETTVDLKSFLGVRPVALFFGSYT